MIWLAPVAHGTVVNLAATLVDLSIVIPNRMIVSKVLSSADVLKIEPYIGIIMDAMCP